MPSVLSTFGVGSGIDTTALIDGLVSADKATRSAALTRRTGDLDARISAMAQVRSALSAVSSSLATRVLQGGLGVQVGSSSSVVGIETRGGGPPAPFDADVRIDQLAGFQTLVAPRLAGNTAPVGTGTLTLTFGTRTAIDGGGFGFVARADVPVAITIAAGDDSLTGLRDAINRAGTSVRASIVSDVQGSTLVLKGGNGGDQAFTLTAAPDAGVAGLERFDYRPEAAALTLGTDARDALLNVDGVDIRRPGNIVDDLMTGVRLRLNGVTAQPVALAGRRDDSATVTAIADLTDALSALRGLVSGFRKAGDSGAAAGPLSGDGTTAAIDARIVGLLSTPVSSGGLTLRDCGVSVTRAGALVFDARRLAQLPESRRGEVDALLKGLTTAAVPGGIAPLQALAGLADAAASGLDRRKTRFAAESLAIDVRNTAYRAQLVSQFAAMERAVAASKSAGSFLDQQIKVWTQSTR